LRQVDDVGVLALDREDLLVAEENEDRQHKIAQCVSALHDCTTA
jgi:hypothetical protein